MALKPIGGSTGATAAGGLMPEFVTAETTAQGEAPVPQGADTLLGEQRFAGALQARQLQSRLAPQDGGQTTQTQEPVVVFRVVVPASGDARAMRDAILKGAPFHYTDADILALEQSSPGEEFYITVGEDGKRGRWATPAEVKKFPVEDGTTAIPVRESLVRDLVAFRARRRVEEATAGIGDPTLRQQVSEQLLAAMTGRGAERVYAGVNLSATARRDESVARALRVMADDPAGRQSAALQLALARTSADGVLARRAGVYGPFDDGADFAEARARAWEAVRLAGGIDPATGRERPGARIDREEAAILNQYAAQLFRQTGDDSSAMQREMIGRFYESDERERGIASLVEWSTIPRWKPSEHGAPFVRPTTEEEQRLMDFDADYRASQRADVPPRDPALEKAKDAKRMEEARIMNPGTRQNRVEMSEDDGAVYTGRMTTRRQREVNGEMFERRTYTEQQVNPGGVRAGRTAAGAVDLVNTGLTYYTLYRKTQELARHQAERAPLQAAATNSTRFPVPPRPDDVERIASALEQARTRTQDPQRKAEFEEALRFIPTMREASRAFWNR